MTIAEVLCAIDEAGSGGAGVLFANDTEQAIALVANLVAMGFEAKRLPELEIVPRSSAETPAFQR